MADLLEEVRGLLEIEGLCNDVQRAKLEAILHYGGVRPAARALGQDHKRVGEVLRTVRRNAARLHGYALGHFTHGVAPGYTMGKVTVMRRADSGEPMFTWERQSPDNNAQAILDAIEERASRVQPLPTVNPPKSFGSEYLFNQVSIFDGHVGAHAWNDETGSGHWDLKIAKEQLMAASAWIIDNMPPAQDCLVLIGGDFTEVDGYKPLTPEHGHLLDADGRYPRIFEVAEEIIEATVYHALRRHRLVHLCLRPGNHDRQTIFALRRVFMRVFRDNPRVRVDQGLREYWCMEFGKTMIACQHGDKVKLEALPMIFAADYAEAWGRTTFRVCHTGHWHHQRTIQTIGREQTGMLVFQHPTMERRNAWAAGKGLIAARQLVGHSYHNGGGLVTQLHYSPDLF